MNNICDCLLKMSILGYVIEYNKLYKDELLDDKDLFDGMLCLVSDKVTSELTYDEYGIKEDFKISSKLIPIKYCPCCGKEIEYTKNKTLQLTDKK